MGIKSFEVIIVWEKNQELTIEIYDYFKHLKDYGFQDQITRSAISFSNNVAEGSDFQVVRNQQNACLSQEET